MSHGEGSQPTPREIPRDFNMADYFLYDRLHEGFADKVAIRTRDEEWTYYRVAEESDRFGNALRDLGVAVGDRVLVSLPDRPEFAAAIYGTLAVGGIVAMVNPLLPADDLQGYVDYTGCKVFVCEPDVAAKIAPAAPGNGGPASVIVVGDELPDGKPFCAYADLVGEASGELDPAPTTREDLAYFLFTSGSTGRPKAAVHRHLDFPWNCERYAKQVLSVTKDDVTLSVPKLYFGYATGTNLFFPMAVGATTCLFPEKPAPDALVENIERFRPTILTSVPTSISQMLEDTKASSADLSSLRAVISAGEALPPELYTRWAKTFGVEILDGIGSAETFHIYITNKPGDVAPGSLGTIVPGYEAKICDPDGNEVPVGEIGTLWVHGESVALEYWENPEATAETFPKPGWVRTADLFRVDDAGRFWYSGRVDDMLKVGGMFVSPLEIEDRLLQHAAVAECAVVPYEDAGLTKPLAFVVLREGFQPSPKLATDIASFAKQGLAAYKFPRRVCFTGPLPRNDRGKTSRKELRAILAEGMLPNTFETDLKGR